MERQSQTGRSSPSWRSQISNDLTSGTDFDSKLSSHCQQNVGKVLRRATEVYSGCMLESRMQMGIFGTLLTLKAPDSDLLLQLHNAAVGVIRGEGFHAERPPAA